MPKLSLFIAIGFLAAIITAPVKAQSINTDSIILASIDTAALYDSILMELEMLEMLGKSPRKSFVDFNAGIGNGNFLLQNANADANNNHLFFNVGSGYYHRSGFSISGGVNITNSSGAITVYQGYISPGYDYQTKKIGLGISGFKYFNKDSLSFYVSPLVNELYGYFIYKKSWLQPKLALDYGWGKYDELESLKQIDTNIYRRYAPLVRYLGNKESIATVSDFSVLLSVRHDFIITNQRKAKQFWRVAPAITLVSGTSKYGTNTPLNSINGPRMANPMRSTYLRDLYENAIAPPPAKFEMQNLNFSTYINFYSGRFYVQSQLLFSYLLPNENAGWNIFYNLGLGFSL